MFDNSAVRALISEGIDLLSCWEIETPAEFVGKYEGMRKIMEVSRVCKGE